MYVDGGLAKDVGVAGFVIYAPGGEEVVRVGEYDVAYTNNQCELQAIQDALQFIVDHGWSYWGDYL